MTHIYGSEYLMEDKDLDPKLEELGKTTSDRIKVVSILVAIIIAVIVWFILIYLYG